MLTSCLREKDYLGLFDLFGAKAIQAKKPKLKLKYYRLMLRILRTYFNPHYWKISQLLLRIARLEYGLANYQ